MLARSFLRMVSVSTLLALLVIVALFLAACVCRPPDPNFAGSIGGNVTNVVVKETTAYLDEGCGLTILDVSDPAHPERLSRTQLRCVNDMQIEGDLAYIADGDGGMLILNVSDPVSPTLISSYETPEGHAVDLHVKEHIAYLSDEQSVQVIDVSDPVSPTRKGQITTSKDFSAIHLAGTTLFVLERDGETTDPYGKLFIYDVQDPSQPVRQGSYYMEENLLAVEGTEDTAYVVLRDHGLHILDVTAPTSPTLLTTYTSTAEASSVRLDGQRAYFVDENIHVLDVTTPASPTLLGSIETPGDAIDVAFRDTLAFVAEGASGLQVVDAADLHHSTLIGTYNTPGSANDVQVRGELAYVTDSSDGLHIINVHNPAAPSPLSVTPISDTARSVHVDPPLAYLASDTGLHILDVSDLLSPTRKGFLALAEGGRDLHIVDSVALMRDNSWLHILDVSDPELPVKMSSHQTPGQWWKDMAVDDSLVYLAYTGDPGGLQIISRTDPHSPTLVGSYQATTYISSMHLIDTTALLSTDEGWLAVDVSDPSNPVGTKPRKADYGVETSYLSGTLLYALSKEHLLVYDVSTPSVPVLRDRYAVPGGTIEVEVVGKVAYIADGYGGLQMIHLRDVPDLQRVYLPLVRR